MPPYAFVRSNEACCYRNLAHRAPRNRAGKIQNPQNLIIKPVARICPYARQSLIRTETQSLSHISPSNAYLRASRYTFDSRCIDPRWEYSRSNPAAKLCPNPSTHRGRPNAETSSALSRARNLPAVIHSRSR